MKKDKLHNIKSTGYKTPDNYFENFEDKFFDKLSEEDSIGVVSPGFKVPKNYFDTIEDNVLNKLKASETPVVKLNTKKKLYYVIGIAASLALLFGIIFNNSNIDEISPEMVEAYFQDSDLDTYEIAELFNEEDLQEEDFTIIETEYNEENIESYLLENMDMESMLQ